MQGHTDNTPSDGTSSSEVGRSAAMPHAILENNLNDTVSYRDFFHAFGYSDTDTIHFRMFNDKDKAAPGKNYCVELQFVDSIIETLHAQNNQDCGVFFVVNGGGDTDKEVKRSGIARACFIDKDDCTLEEQLDLLNAFPLEPSIVVRTSKSLHAYWITPGGGIGYFRELQERFIQYFRSDIKIKNESRVMRLYGFDHCKADPVRVRLIKFNPELTYTQRQLHEALPLLSKPAATTKRRTERTEDELIPHGQRHYYVMEQLGHYVAKLPDSSGDVILQALYQDFMDNCQSIPEDSFEKFRREYLPTINKYLGDMAANKKDPDYYKHARRAWLLENPGRDWDNDGGTWEAAEAALLKHPEVMTAARSGTKQEQNGVQRSESNAQDKTGTVTEEEILAAVVSMADIEEEQVYWMSYPRMPRGEVTLLAAPGGTGKGFAVASWLAGLTHGRAPDIMPECVPFKSEPEKVLYLTTEDSAGKVIKPRLTQAGADMSKVQFIDKGSPIIQQIDFADENRILDTLLRKVQPTLVVFDPLQSFLPEKTRMSERNQMRRTLNNLSVFSEKYGTTFLIFCHLNKRDTTDARQALADSSDLWDIARSVIFIGRTGEGDTLYLSHEKSNYAAPAHTELFRIDEPGKAVHVGYSEKRFADYAAAAVRSTRGAPQREEAKEIIVNALMAAPDKCMKTAELEELCIASGVTAGTLKRSKAELNKEGIIKMYSYGFGDDKTWYIGLREEGRS